VPAETARFRRRVRPRDLWFERLAAALLAVGAPAAVLLADSGSGSPHGGRCVTTIETGFMGGQTRRYCGPAAVTFCRSRAAARRTELDATCRRLTTDPRG
jgi:hypothetical protein